jgi:hypothetical protein
MTEIPQREWPQFLERLAREHRAWLATVEQNGRIAALQEPLHAIRANRGIEILIGAHAVHVDAPLAVRVQQTSHGAAQALEIEDQAGGRVTLRFRIAEPPGELDGIAPAER